MFDLLNALGFASCKCFSVFLGRKNNIPTLGQRTKRSSGVCDSPSGLLTQSLGLTALVTASKVPQVSQTPEDRLEVLNALGRKLLEY